MKKISEPRVRLINPQTKRKKYYNAKELAIIKWEMIRDERPLGDEVYNSSYIRGTYVTYYHPLLSQLQSSCAYCHLYIKGNCVGCPLYLEGMYNCLYHTHPYFTWLHHGQTKDQAQEVLDLILSK